jgi:transcriptional regulator with XRE-family HTH domain
MKEDVIDVQELSNWRDALAKLARDSHAKQDVARTLNISQATLTRWINGDSKPRRQNMRRLSQLLPEYHTFFAEMQLEHADESPVASEGPEYTEIPSIFYARVLNAHCNLPRVIHFSSLCDVILQQALKQLDPHRVGMEVTVVQCMHPVEGGVIRSLRENIGQATPPWNRETDPKIMFLGSESLAGFVVTTGRQLAIENRQKVMSRFPAQWVDWEESAMGYPIMRSDLIAGCLLVSSAQSEYFVSLNRQKLIQYYAELLSVIFEPENFYPLQKVALGYMPTYDIQSKYIATFRQRTANRMMERQLNVVEAERLVWQEIEDELLHSNEIF